MQVRKASLGARKSLVSRVTSTGLCNRMLDASSFLFRSQSFWPFLQNRARELVETLSLEQIGVLKPLQLTWNGADVELNWKKKCATLRNLFLQVECGAQLSLHRPAFGNGVVRQAGYYEIARMAASIFGAHCFPAGISSRSIHGENPMPRNRAYNALAFSSSSRA